MRIAILTLSLYLIVTAASAQKIIRVCVAGMNHDHIHGILSRYKDGTVDIVGISEPNRELWVKYGKLYHIPDSLFFTDLKTMLLKKKPDAVLGYNTVANHIDVVKICAPMHIPVMVEKPLAATLNQAKQIEALANQYHIKVLTNYETTWYPSYQYIHDMVAQDSIGAVKKVVFHDGHQGPVEIGCSKEFLAWLTDPVLNGAGALNDFGCYGADLITWFMKGEHPIAVTAIGRHYKPQVYPKVEDDATVLVEYPGATCQLEASWNWPFGIKDMEVFGETGYYHGIDRDNVASRMRENKRAAFKTAALTPPISDPILYLTAVLQNKISGDDDQSSLKYNMVAMEILDAAKRSIIAGKRIVLQ